MAQSLKPAAPSRRDRSSIAAPSSGCAMVRASASARENCSASVPFCAALAYISRAGNTIVIRTIVATPRSIRPTKRCSCMSSTTLPGVTSSHVDRKSRRSISPRGVPRCYGPTACTYLYNIKHLSCLRHGSSFAQRQAQTCTPFLIPTSLGSLERTFNADCNLDRVSQGWLGHVAHPFYLGGHHRDHRGARGLPVPRIRRQGQAARAAEEPGHERQRPGRDQGVLGEPDADDADRPGRPHEVQQERRRGPGGDGR